MDSDLHHHYHHRQQQQTINSGLTRYRSAPSSYFSDLINNTLFSDDNNNNNINNNNNNNNINNNINNNNNNLFFNPRVSNAQTDQVINQIGGFEPQYIDSIKQEEQGIYSDSQPQPMIYQNQNQNQFQLDDSNHSVSTCSSTIEDNFPANLLRQNSSPAGFIANNLDIENGYPLVRSLDDYRGGRGNAASSMLTSAKRSKNEIGFSSGSTLSNGILPRIPENEAKVMEMKIARNDGGFGSNSWDDSDMLLSDSFMKEFGESDRDKLSSLNLADNQRHDVGRIRGPTKLVHHLSLPANTAELDKIMQFQDLVPLKGSRAKRGCATHPRSIAERVRRTRISERMRKLQDLVPNMDKQTNTADMLDLAVDYIKELQKEAETLSDNHAKCTCPHKQKV